MRVFQPVGGPSMRKSARLAAAAALAVLAAPLLARSQPAAAPVDNSNAPQIPFETEEFGKLKPGQNFGEILGVAVNSKGRVVILNHPGSATTGPVYGNAS